MARFPPGHCPFSSRHNAGRHPLIILECSIKLLSNEKVDQHAVPGSYQLMIVPKWKFQSIYHFLTVTQCPLQLVHCLYPCKMMQIFCPFWLQLDAWYCLFFVQCNFWLCLFIWVKTSFTAVFIMNQHFRFFFWDSVLSFYYFWYVFLYRQTRQ